MVARVRRLRRNPLWWIFGPRLRLEDWLDPRQASDGDGSRVHQVGESKLYGVE